MSEYTDDEVRSRVDLIRKWFRAESHGPTFKGTSTVSSWYLDFETTEEIGKAYVGTGRWSAFSVKAMYSIDEPA